MLASSQLQISKLKLAGVGRPKPRELGWGLIRKIAEQIKVAQLSTFFGAVARKKMQERLVSGAQPNCKLISLFQAVKRNMSNL